jgi:hypothetical protein
MYLQIKELYLIGVSLLLEQLVSTYFQVAMTGTNTDLKRCITIDSSIQQLPDIYFPNTIGQAFQLAVVAEIAVSLFFITLSLSFQVSYHHSFLLYLASITVL